MYVVLVRSLPTVNYSMSGACIPNLQEYVGVSCECVYIYIHTYIHTYMHACMHACMRACMHAYMHAYIHTYIHTYIYM